MKLIVLILTFLTCTSLSTCKKEPPEIPPYVQPNTSVLETVWSHNSPFYSTTPIKNSNGDILVSKMFNNTGKGEIFKLLDKNTGTIKWEWSDYLVPKEGFTTSIRTQINDVLVLSDGKRNYALNIMSGQTIWKNTFDSMSAEPQIYKDEDGYIYKGFSSNTTKSTVYIFRAMYNTGNWEWVCTYKDQNPIEGRFEIASIGVTKNSKKEKIVSFTIYTYYPNSQDSTKALIVGYNLATQSFEWEKNYRKDVGEFSVFMYTSYKDIVYAFSTYGSTYYLIAFDVNNGNISWQKQLPNFGVGIYFYKENLIVASNGESPTLCLNQLTGALQWQQSFSQFTAAQKSNLNFSFGDSKVFQKYFLSTQCDNLLVLDADNGSVLFYDKTALPEGCLQHGLAIDEERRVFYAEDRQRVLCYKLPDVVKY